MMEKVLMVSYEDCLRLREKLKAKEEFTTACSVVTIGKLKRKRIACVQLPDDTNLVFRVAGKLRGKRIARRN